MIRLLQSVGVGFCLLGLLACGPEPVGAKPTAWVTIQPQRAFVQELVGDSVAVEVLVRPGQSPETYAPSAAQMAKLAKADWYFGIGVPLEARLFEKLTASMPNLQVVEFGEPAAHAHHDHVHHAGCAHGDVDPHVWMDPVQMAEFVLKVSKQLPESVEAANRLVADLQNG